MTGQPPNSDKGLAFSGFLFDPSPRYSTSSEIVRRAAAADLKMCGISRAEVAVRLSARVGRPISVAMIDAYVADSKPHHFPAELIPAWVEVTSSLRILEVLCEEAGLSVATQDDRDFAALGRANLGAEKLTRRLWEKI
jgi:hypothetical protein